MVTLRREDYLKIRTEVRPLPGTQFPEDIRDLAPTRAVRPGAARHGGPGAPARTSTPTPTGRRRATWSGTAACSSGTTTELRGTAGQSVVIARKAPDDTVTDAADRSAPSRWPARR